MYYRGNIYCICNPYTKQWVALPSAPPCEKDVPVGFTCDSENRCFKVVRILGFKLELEAPPLEVELFSSETGKWNKLDLVLQGTKPNFYNEEKINEITAPVAHNGALYWITTSSHHIGLKLFSKSNINNTECQGRFICNPNSLNPYYMTARETLCVCQGSVRRCRFYSGPERRHSLYAWDLKEDDKWSFKESVDLQPDIPRYGKRYRLLAFDPNDEDILYLWRDEYPSENMDILLCNIRKLTVTEISQKFQARAFGLNKKLSVCAPMVAVANTSSSTKLATTTH